MHVRVLLLCASVLFLKANARTGKRRCAASMRSGVNWMRGSRPTAATFRAGSMSNELHPPPKIGTGANWVRFTYAPAVPLGALE